MLTPRRILAALTITALAVLIPASAASATKHDENVNEWHTWLTDTAPGVTTPQGADDVTWPQAYLGAGKVDPPCGVWVQQDRYVGTRSQVDAILADGILTRDAHGIEDRDVVKAWRFVHGEPCPTQEPTPTPTPTVTPEPTPTPTETPTEEPTPTPTPEPTTEPTPSSTPTPSPSPTIIGPHGPTPEPSICSDTECVGEPTPPEPSPTKTPAVVPPSSSPTTPAPTATPVDVQPGPHLAETGTSGTTALAWAISLAIVAGVVLSIIGRRRNR